MLPIQRTSSQQHIGSTPNAMAGSNAATSKIGDHEISDLTRHASALIQNQITTTFIEARHIPGRMKPTNLVMLATLQVVNRTLHEAGIGLSDHAPLPEGISTLLGNVHTLALQILSAKNPGWANVPDQIELHTEEIEQLQRSIDTSGSPFARIPSEHRWRMCLDPKVVDQFERHIRGARHNRLLPFAFDSEPGYLRGLLNGWNKSMNNLQATLNTDFIVSLLKACCPEHVPADNEYLMGGFGLTLGDNMTPEGREELLEFMRYLGEALPGFTVTATREEALDFHRRLANAGPDEYVAPPPEPTGDEAHVVHPEVKFSLMRQCIDELLEHYREDIQDCDNDDERLETIVDLCQKLERLHPFPDGNCRAFGIVLLNHLLVRNGFPLTMLNDPNILDGWSRQQVMQEIVEGWDRVKAYAQPRRAPGVNASRHDAMRDRLNNLSLSENG